MKIDSVFGFNKNYMDQTHCLSYKGIFAVLVLVSHIASALINYYGISAAKLLTPLGYLSVSAFLFFSGYGLAFSVYKGKGTKGFVRNKILPIYTLYLVFAFIYCLFYYFMLDVNITFDNIVKTLLIGKTYVANGWYFQCIILLYLSYYLCERAGLLKKKLLAPLFIVFPYILICIFLKLDYIYVQSVLAFCGGYYYFLFKEKIDGILSQKGKYLATALVVFLSFAFSFAGFLFFENVILKLILKMLTCFIFPLLFAVLSARIRFHCRIAAFFGGISLEFYIVQGLFLMLFFEYAAIHNVILYIALVCILTFIFSIIVNYLRMRLKVRK